MTAVSPYLKLPLRSEEEIRTQRESALIVEPCEFWFVWTKTGHIPRYRHSTQASAEAEADRLAMLKPYGKKYLVLRGYRKCHVAPDQHPDLAAPASVHVEEKVGAA